MTAARPGPCASGRCPWTEAVRSFPGSLHHGGDLPGLWVVVDREFVQVEAQ
jgi:hypothetical protein